MRVAIFFPSPEKKYSPEAKKMMGTMVKDLAGTSGKRRRGRKADREEKRICSSTVEKRMKEVTIHERILKACILQITAAAVEKNQCKKGGTWDICVSFLLAEMMKKERKKEMKELYNCNTNTATE